MKQRGQRSGPHQAGSGSSIEVLAWDEFTGQLEDYDRQVEESEDIDRWCSSSGWVVPAHQAFGPHRDPWIRRTPDGYLVFAQDRHGRVWKSLEPLEACWGLACPVVGSNARELARQLVIATRAEPDWMVLVLTGLIPRSARFEQLVRALEPHAALQLHGETRRQIASLEGGLDGFLSRRTAKLRENLRRESRMVRAAGITFEAGDPSTHSAGELYDRIQEVEVRSWKGMRQVGIQSGGMYDFYERMVQRLHTAGGLRLLFARHEGRDVAYILGGISRACYRGLQFSYDAAYRRFGLGNVIQLEMVARIADEGVLEYDLGVDLEYKQRWSDRSFDTVTLVAMRM